MEKKIYIVNGMGGCGKDTFATFLRKCVPGVYKTSAIDKIKCIAKILGWNGGKTEKDRKFLSDLKCLTTAYNDFAFNVLKEEVEDFRIYCDSTVLLIDIREPEEIDRAKKEFNAKTILIENPRVPHIHSNMADDRVFEYDYDCVIRNDGTLEQFYEIVKIWARKEGLMRGICE